MLFSTINPRVVSHYLSSGSATSLATDGGQKDSDNTTTQAPKEPVRSYQNCRTREDKTSDKPLSIQTRQEGQPYMVLRMTQVHPANVVSRAAYLFYIDTAIYTLQRLLPRLVILPSETSAPSSR